jgi:release factor glutamine methyltransferase
VTDPHALVRSAEQRLAEAGVPSPAYDARALLEHVLDAEGRLALVREVSDAQAESYAELVSRRMTREPLQHLTGTTGFRYVSLHVGPGVFVPRPETEELAGWAIDRARESESPLVVDLCTGSGAIAASVAHEVRTARVYAVELDPGAFVWAERNLAGTTVDLRQGDMGDAFPELDGTVDVVVCNPPYIPLEACESVAPEARDHDPALALWSGDDGLDAMRVLEATAARLLRPGGWVGAEHADVQGESAARVFLDAGRWTDVRDHRDLAGRDRYVVARLAR